MTIKQISLMTAGFALVASMAIASSANAESTSTSTPSGIHKTGIAKVLKNHKPGTTGVKPQLPEVVGKVTAVNGNTITVTKNAHREFKRGTSTPVTTTTPPAPIIYTIDASNAVVIKGNATSTVASITVGDVLSVQGTVSGTNVTATKIRDNSMMLGKDRLGFNGKMGAKVTGKK